MGRAESACVSLWENEINYGPSTGHPKKKKGPQKEGGKARGNLTELKVTNGFKGKGRGCGG